MNSRDGRELRLSARIPQQQGRRGENGEIPAQRLGAEQRSPAQEAYLLTRRGRRELGAEAWASVLARRESGKKSAAAEEARDFFLPLCFVAREEKGFRAPPKRTPETGTSRGYQHGSKRRARAAANSADPRDRREPRLSARTTETGVRHWGCCCRLHKSCVRAQVTLHTAPPGSLCSPPLPGSPDPGTTSPGEFTAHLRLLQRHAGLCRRRLTPPPLYPSLPVA